MPMGTTALTRTIPITGTSTPKIDMRGKRLLAIYAPTLDSAKIRLQGSYDNGANWADLKDTTPAVLEFVASTGGFWLDADYLCRFLGIPDLRITVSAAQNTAARDFTVIVSDG